MGPLAFHHRLPATGLGRLSSAAEPSPLRGAPIAEPDPPSASPGKTSSTQARWGPLRPKLHGAPRASAFPPLSPHRLFASRPRLPPLSAPMAARPWPCRPLLAPVAGSMAARSRQARSAAAHQGRSWWPLPTEAAPGASDELRFSPAEGPAFSSSAVFTSMTAAARPRRPLLRLRLPEGRAALPGPPLAGRDGEGRRRRWGVAGACALRCG